jgi:hypothetical protein
LDHRIVTIGAAVAQFAEAQHDVDDQLKKYCRGTESLAGGQAAKAPVQARPQIEHREKLLEQNQPGERGEGVVLALEHRQGVGLTANVGSAKLHGADLLVV